MNHRSPHHRADDEVDPEPGQLPVDPDDGQAPSGLPTQPDPDGPLDPPV